MGRPQRPEKFHPAHGYYLDQGGLNPVKAIPLGFRSEKLLKALSLGITLFPLKKNMKTKLLIWVLVMSAFSCKAQIYPRGIIPVENFAEYQGEIHDRDYIKDVNNLLDKYEGTWIGTYSGKEYKVAIEKKKSNFLGITGDILLLRYKITDSNGQEIINTLNISDEDTRIVDGEYLENGGEPGEYYVMDYLGEESMCGQKGSIYIDFLNGDYNHLHLFLAPGRHRILIND